MSKLKTKITSVFLIAMLLITTLVFSACGAVSGTIISNQDGSIEERILITLADVNLSPEDKTDITKDIMAQWQLKSDKELFDYNKRVFEDSSDYVTKYYGYLNQAMTADDRILNDGSILLVLKFDNILAYRYYYGIKDDTFDIKYETEQHLLYTKVIQRGNTLFARHSKVYQEMYNLFAQNYPQIVTADDTMLYVYQTDQKRQHSNADKITYSLTDQKYYHTWIVDSQNVNTDMYLYYKIANVGNWIIIAICLTLITIVIMYTIAIIIKLSTKNKKSYKKR